MSVDVPPPNIHHVPPLPQRRSSMTGRRSSSSSASPLIPARHRVSAVSGPVPPSVINAVLQQSAAPADSAASSVPPVQLSSTLTGPRSRRAPDNDYREDIMLPANVEQSIMDTRTVIRAKDIDDTAVTDRRLTASQTTTTLKSSVVEEPSKPPLTLKATNGELLPPAGNGQRSPSPCRRTPTYCPRCGKCRCAECARPPTTIFCCSTESAERAVDFCSCVYCVQSVLDRCCPRLLDDDEDDADADDTAGRPRCRAACCRRWTLLAVLSACLPCLCCYWPLHCGVEALRCCSTTCTGGQRGCRCQPPTGRVVEPLVTSQPNGVAAT